jgi:hypothetical protein
MKKHVFAISILVLFCLAIQAQDVYIQIDVNGVVNKKISKELDKGTKFKSLILKSIQSENSGTYTKKQFQQ